MDRFEYKLRADSIKALIQEKRYKEAVDIADTIDWKNVKNTMMLCTVSDLYKACKRYEDSRDVLELAYQKNPGGRAILYSLCELSIKLGDVVNAIEYFKEYAQVASQDSKKYILRYKLYTAEGVGIDERIAVLEELQRRECKEKWMYELAYLYHMAGYSEKCVEECNQLVLYFGEGTYVIKALELKALHEPLSSEQDYLYRRLTGPAEPDIVYENTDMSNYNALDLEKDLANSLKEVLFDDSKVEEAVVSDITNDINQPEFAENTYVQTPIYEQLQEVTEASEVTINLSSVGPIKSEAVEEVEDNTKVIDTKAVNAAIEKQSEVSQDTTEIKFERMRLEPLITNPNFKGRVIEPVKTNSFDMHEISIGDKNSAAIKFPNYDDMVSLEGDGQISMNIPEQEMIEKQITGQISIEDVLAEWERMKKESDQKWQDDVRKRVQSQANDIFRNFDESAKKGLLEELEVSVSSSPTVELTIEEQKSLLAEENADKLNITVDDVREAEEKMNCQYEEIYIDDPDEKDKEEPSLEELSFDRTPYIEKQIETEYKVESNNPEPEDYDNTGVIPETDAYLEAFAAASEARELAEKAFLDNKATDEMLSVSKPEANIVEELVAESEADEEIATIAESVEETKTNETSDAVEMPDVMETLETEESVEIDEAGEQDTTIETDESDELEATTESKTITGLEGEEEAKESVTKEEQYTSEEVTEDGFTDLQRERFEDFIQTENGREQILNALNTISVDADKNNVIIGSEDIDSAIELGKLLITEFAEQGLITGKVAKIKASTLNAKDPIVTLSSLDNGALIIQDAHELRAETLAGLTQVITEPKKKMLIVFTAPHRLKHRFIMANPELVEHFNVNIDIEALSDDELVEYAIDYAYAREYGIDEMGLLALHRKIDERQTNSHSVTISEIKSMIEDAIEKAAKKNVGHFFEVLVGKRYDDNDMVVLKEKDFE